jgi:hypothetical protein
MPESCFSYEPPRMIPGGRGERGYPCFSYPAGLRPADLRRAPEGSGCFSYPGDVPLGIGNRGIEPRPGRGIRRMPGGEMKLCFSYYG